MKRFLFAVLAISVGFVAGLVVTGRIHTSLSGEAASAAAPRAADQAARPAAEPAAPPRALAGLPDFTDVAARVVGAVTNISSQQVTRAPNSPFGNDPFFRVFLRR